MRQLSQIFSLGLVLCASPLFAQSGSASGEIDPPPPPPAPQSQPQPMRERDPVKAAQPSALERYQECFQEMIDTGANENSFMRQCLGIEDQLISENEKKPRITHDDVNAILTPALSGSKGIEGCYGELIERSKSLQLIPEGVIDPVLTIGDKGNVKAVAFNPTQFMDVSLLECVRKRLAALSFRKAAPDTVIKTSLRFGATGAKRIPKVTLVPGYPRLSGPSFGFSERDVFVVFQKYSPRIRGCYDDLTKRNPKASGTVTVELTVNLEGRVKRINYHEVTIQDRRFKACVNTQLKTFRFPKPAGDEDIVVRYPPFTFTPASQR